MNEKVKEVIMNPIDFDSGIPLKIQLRDIIRNKVTANELVDEHGKLATEHELMEQFNVSRVTVRSALQMLVDEGVIVRRRGSGTFLRTNHPENWVGRLMGFSETQKESGMEPGAEVLLKGNTKGLDVHIRDKLNVTEAWQLKRLRTSGNIPIAIEHAFFPTEYQNYFETENLASLAVYKYLEENKGIYLQDARQLISAINADKEEAGMLKIKENDALLYLERTTYTENNKPVEFLKAVYQPEYFQYLIKLSRRN
ncbi:hypothetical protein CIL03_12855 [Virgibacillus indicus]|uniref:HTH gntR-type domain-containing protein n=1 Tax=Virgibacillus indicus TaxID=2024554 RepID=A0A265N892_9BACI|nr:GntR family transcriptional regulator [Virgibacillus indicus]OZU88021.1 hypothetical protein CIL03_12855 [Virgibacillus indicus]